MTDRRFIGADVLAYLERDPGATTAETGEAFGRSVRQIRPVLNRLVRKGLARRVWDGERYRWHAGSHVQRDCPGLTARLYGLCSFSVSVEAVIDATGWTGAKAIRGAALDRPDVPQQRLTRAVAAQGARILARRMRERADLLDQWAKDAEAA